MLTPRQREIYDIVRAQVEKAPDAKFQDLFETLYWVVQNGYATAEELEAVEEENQTSSQAFPCGAP